MKRCFLHADDSPSSSSKSLFLSLTLSPSLVYILITVSVSDIRSQALHVPRRRSLDLAITEKRKAVPIPVVYIAVLVAQLLNTFKEVDRAPRLKVDAVLNLAVFKPCNKSRPKCERRKNVFYLLESGYSEIG